MLVGYLELNPIKKTVFVPSFLLGLKGRGREFYGFKVLDFWAWAVVCFGWVLAIFLFVIVGLLVLKIRFNMGCI